MKPYVVFSPAFDRSSGGIVCLHRLAVELQRRGEQVYLNTEIQNSAWDKVPIWKNDNPDSIAILPEILFSNPFVSKTVVHYLLNLPGQCGGPKEMPTDGICYTYSRLFNTKLCLPNSQVLLTPTIDLSVFYDMKLKRDGRCVYRGKGQQPLDSRLSCYPLLGEKEGFKGEGGQKRLAEKLNRTEMLFSLDDATAITELSRLCGCPVIIVGSNTYTKNDYQQHEFWDCGGICWEVEEAAIARSTIDSEKMRAAYEEAEIEFQRRLTNFIEVTQNG